MKLTTMFILSFSALCLNSACTERDYIAPETETVYQTASNGETIPLANLTIVTTSGTVIYAGIDGNSEVSVDTARFKGVTYSEDIASISYTLPDGATISPLPAAVSDSVEIAIEGTNSTKMKREYWDQVTGPFTITTADGSEYQVAFKLEDYVAAKENENIDTDYEPSETEAGTVFIDRFNSTDDSTPDTDSWQLVTGSGSTWLQYMNNTEGYECVDVSDGMLYLTAKVEDSTYKTGGIRTTFGFAPNTRVEARLRMSHKVTGGFPAFWQMPYGSGVPNWPAGGEVDIMEWVVANTNYVWHTCHVGPSSSVYSSFSSSVRSDVTEWHVYAVERTDEAITWYIDNAQTHKVTRTTIEAAQTMGYPFGEYNFDIILNMSLGGSEGDWPGETVDDSSLPVQLIVDWVRVMDISESSDESSAE
ncbi:MAG: family 16 glycosylhydrolase [Bacteroides sp.]|nr:family 16 glycosylhydrolase [Bacteroides sp.]